MAIAYLDFLSRFVLRFVCLFFVKKKNVLENTILLLYQLV